MSEMLDYNGTWISPEARVPDHDDDVLVSPQNIWGPTMKYSRMRCWHIWDDAGTYFVSMEPPKYWTELPEGPE